MERMCLSCEEVLEKCVGDGITFELDRCQACDSPLEVSSTSSGTAIFRRNPEEPSFFIRLRVPTL